MSEDQHRFLSRWSRRKTEAREGAGGSNGAPNGAPDGEPKPASPPVASPTAMLPSGTGENTVPSSPGAPLPPIEELRGLASEYRDFLRPEVDESLRRAALKQLFQDPHFNIMDGLDTYIDDYSKADPIPEAMLRGLNQARGLIFDREGEHDAHAGQPAGTDAVLEQPKAAETASREPGAADDRGAAQPNSNKPSAAA